MTVFERYARVAPQALDGLTTTERERLYALLRLWVTVEIDGDLKRSDTFSRCCGQSTHRSGPTFSATIAGGVREVSPESIRPTTPRRKEDRGRETGQRSGGRSEGGWEVGRLPADPITQPRKRGFSEQGPEIVPRASA